MIAVSNVCRTPFNPRSLSYNYLESLWMRGYELLWVVFVIVAVEIGRYWQPSGGRGGLRIEDPKRGQSTRPRTAQLVIR
jgi:hypothetical protein